MNKAHDVKKSEIKPKKGKLKTMLSLTGLVFGVVIAAYMVTFTQAFLRAMDDALSKNDS